MFFLYEIIVAENEDTVMEMENEHSAATSELPDVDVGVDT